MNGLFVDADNEEAMRSGYVRIDGRRDSFEEVAYQASGW